MATLDIVTRATLDAIIRERTNYRRFYRRQPDPARYADLASENTLLLRELLRIRRMSIREATRQDTLYRGDLRRGDFYAGMAS